MTPIFYVPVFLRVLYKAVQQYATLSASAVCVQGGQNCTTPPFNRNFGIFLGWHVIIWDGSQVKAFPNPDHPPLAIFLTYQAFCTGMKILHLILLRFVKLESEISLLI